MLRVTRLMLLETSFEEAKVRTSGVGRIPPVRLLGDALEGPAVILHLHELARQLVPLLPIAVVALELGPLANRAYPISVAGVLAHESLLRSPERGR